MSCAGCEDGALECFDPRSRKSLGAMMAASAVGAAGDSITALRFDDSGLFIAAGTSGVPPTDLTDPPVLRMLCPSMATGSPTKKPHSFPVVVLPPCHYSALPCRTTSARTSIGSHHCAPHRPTQLSTLPPSRTCVSLHTPTTTPEQLLPPLLPTHVRGQRRAHNALESRVVQAARSVCLTCASRSRWS